MAEAISVRKYCVRFLKKMKSEIDNDEHLQWTLELLLEKLSSVEKHQGKLENSFVEIEKSDELTGEKKDSMLDENLDFETTFMQIKAKLKKREHELQMQNAKTLKEAYTKQLKKEQEAHQAELRRQQQIQDEEENLVKNALVQVGHFDGKYANWLKFHGKIKRCVSENVNLHEHLKHRMLKQALKISASSLHKMLGNNNVNELAFQTILDKLSEHYEVPYLQMQVTMQKLVEIPKLSYANAGDWPELIQALDDCAESWKHFSNEDSEKLVVVFLLVKLCPDVYKVWELFYVEKAKEQADLDISNVPSWELVKEFLVTDQNNAKASNQWSPKYPSAKECHAEFLQCSLCPEVHPAYACNVYLGMSLDDRLNYIDGRGWCRKCLRLLHTNQPCEGPKCNLPCPECLPALQYHNSTLCPARNACTSKTGNQ